MTIMIIMTTITAANAAALAHYSIMHLQTNTTLKQHKHATVIT